MCAIKPVVKVDISSCFTAAVGSLRKCKYSVIVRPIYYLLKVVGSRIFGRKLDFEEEMQLRKKHLYHLEPCFKYNFNCASRRTTFVGL